MSAAKLNAWFWSGGVRVGGVVDLEYGDTGKGKVVDILTEQADVVARGTGGANAGHTIIYDGKKFVCHLLPSSIPRDGEGKLSIIGRGVAADPIALCEEIAQVEQNGGTWGGLRVSHRALLVLPVDIALDRLSDAVKGDGAIGTTGRGMGPVYQSKAGRTALRMNDLCNKDVFAAKLRRNLADRIALLKGFDEEVYNRIFADDALKGCWDSARKTFDPDAIVEQYMALAMKFRDVIVDTDLLIQKEVEKGKRVLLEGAQGLLLSVEYGAEPYQTSSDCSLQGLAQGVGLGAENVDRVINIAKAPYMTRVGAGPFPTELGGSGSALHCSVSKKSCEEGDWDINSDNPHVQGIAIRRKGDEYGATTGRPRRTGWLDLPLLNYASGWAGFKGDGCPVILTKMDVLSACQTIRLCTGHIYDGEDYCVGGALLQRGRVLERAVMDTYVLEHSVAQYEDYPGWMTSLNKEMTYADLPQELKEIVAAIEQGGGVDVKGISMGPDREDLIVF